MTTSLTFDAPGPGQWTLDRSHFPGGTTPITEWLITDCMAAGMEKVFAEVGVPAKRIDARFVNGFMYTRLIPLIGGDRPPGKLPPTPRSSSSPHGSTRRSGLARRPPTHRSPTGRSSTSSRLGRDHPASSGRTQPRTPGGRRGSDHRRRTRQATSASCSTSCTRTWSCTSNSTATTSARSPDTSTPRSGGASTRRLRRQPSRAPRRARPGRSPGSPRSGGSSTNPMHRRPTRSTTPRAVSPDRTAP